MELNDSTARIEIDAGTHACTMRIDWPVHVATSIKPSTFPILIPQTQIKLPCATWPHRYLSGFFDNIRTRRPRARRAAGFRQGLSLDLIHISFSGESSIRQL
jgi:hypothetical protein